MCLVKDEIIAERPTLPRVPPNSCVASGHSLLPCSLSSPILGYQSPTNGLMGGAGRGRWKRPLAGSRERCRHLTRL